MTGVLALVWAVTALTALPPLPARGLALETDAGVQLQTLTGRPLATLPGLDLASDQLTAHTLVVRDRRGRLFVLEGRHLRRIPLRRGCRATDVGLVVCPRVIKRDGRVVVRAPTPYPAGHWEWAAFAPGRDALLAQWIAECEVPVAYLFARGKLRAYGGESVALGWLPSGEALIHFPQGPCGAASRPRGIYAVSRTQRVHLILRTRRFAQYAMWGG